MEDWEQEEADEQAKADIADRKREIRDDLEEDDDENH